LVPIKVKSKLWPESYSKNIHVNGNIHIEGAAVGAAVGYTAVGR
jgi:hypothetical protein